MAGHMLQALWSSCRLDDLGRLQSTHYTLQTTDYRLRLQTTDYISRLQVIQANYTKY